MIGRRQDGISSRIAGVALSLTVLAGSSCTSKPSDEVAAPRPAACENDPDKPLAARPVRQLFLREEAVETAIAGQAGLKREAVTIDKSVTEPKRDPGTTPLSVDRLQRSPIDLPNWAEQAASDLTVPLFRRCLRADGGLLAEALGGLFRSSPAGKEIRRPPGPPLAPLRDRVDTDQPLVEAFRAVFSVKRGWPGQPAGEDFGPALESIRSMAGTLDLPAQQAVAAVIVGMAAAEEWRLSAVGPWYGDRVEPDLADLASVVSTRELSPERARSFHRSMMAEAGMFVAGAVEGLAAHLRSNPLPTDLSFRLATPLGEVVLAGGSADDTYTSATPALIVDQGGADTYQGAVAGPGQPWVPLSAVVDIAGDDRYVAGDAVGSQGAGLLSFGVLVDEKGNDIYEANDVGQGAAFLGVGALLDLEGNDKYSARYHAQGSGQFGLGVALDLAGNDERRITSYGQGYGSALGAGAVVDLAGDDVFEADDTQLVNPARDQAPGHNLSFAQGAAGGRPADGEGQSMAGGTGLLVDMGGADRYSCGVLCQGAGYWYGNGALVDAGGDDSYLGASLVQGSASHFALGTFIDEVGNDTVKATVSMAQGVGHEGAVGAFVDGAGDDRYALAASSHGVSSDGGFGLFVDRAGDDIHDAGSGVGAPAFGQTSSVDFSRGPRAGASALAVFFDLAGKDQYPGAPNSVGDDARWRLGGLGWAPKGHVGLGWDS